MDFDFDDFMEVLDEDEFEERPVDLEEFVTSKRYLGLPPLSEEQYKLIRASTQIYKKESLINLYGEKEGLRRYKETCFEILAQWGKGSGKDYCSTISIARIVYLLMCLKNHGEYYGRPSDTSIDIINIAINAEQARNVFFKEFTRRIENCPWFEGKYRPLAGAIEFEKGITCYSGHSDKESWEGYNVFAVVLDEISGFEMEGTGTGQNQKTAQSIWEMYYQSVVSRYPDFGKVIELSFPRYKGDFIQSRYNTVVNEKVTEIRHHTFKVDEDLPDGTEGNEFTITYEVDNVISYSEPRVYATKKPSWLVHPNKRPEDYKASFMRNPVDTLARFACMPPEAVDAFFKSREKVEAAFSILGNPFTDTWQFKEWFVPEPNATYFMHVDLAEKHDRCAVALAHVQDWRRVNIGGQYTEVVPFVKIDAVRYWTPKSDQNVNFAEVRDYIVSLKQRGFNIKLVTFDRWNSVSMIQDLKAAGMEAEKLSVAKSHYEDMALMIEEERIKGHKNDLLIDEMLELQIVKANKVDHPRKGSKDLSDAVVGAAYNAVAYTVRFEGQASSEVEISFLGAPGFRTNAIREEEAKLHRGGPIRAPRGEKPPADLEAYLSRMGVI